MKAFGIKEGKKMSETIADSIKKQKIIAIARGLHADEYFSLAHALYEGGIRHLELTFNQSAPETHADDCGHYRNAGKGV